MSDIIIPNYKIWKEPVLNSEGLITEINYEIRYNAHLENGSGRLEFKRVNSYPIVQSHFPELKPEDKLAEIGSFFPHSIDNVDCEDSARRYEERLRKYTEHGIGTALLEQMILDSKENSCKVIYQSTNKPKMQSLLRKHDFISDNIIDVWYFRLL